MTAGPDTPGPAAPTGRRPRRRRFRRTRALLGRIPHPPLRSRRGILLLVVIGVTFGAIMAAGGLAVIHYTETAAFCGRCHTMSPELANYKRGPHRDVACAECHVEPGIKGFIKAKINGTKQVIEIVTGSYPRPIPAPEHTAMPSPTQTCQKCHAVDELTANGGPVRLVLRPRYLSDQSNTRQMLAVVVRPSGLGEGDASGAKGVHWHIDQNVEFSSPDGRGRKIDLVRVTNKDGTEKTFVAKDQVSVSSDVTPDVKRILATQESRRMDCTDCHNRVGHPQQSVERAVDEKMASGEISADLPWIKRDAVALLKGDYASTDDADAAIARLRQSYAAKYPLVLKMRDAQVNEAVKQIQILYRLVATPQMKVTARTYPDNLGHQSSLGCFRCHDGGHYRVEGQRLTPEKIPSACATCHTFPQAGPTVSGIPLGGEPKSHKPTTWVFTHKKSVSSLDPASTSCATCHAKAYCENCHNTGATKITHNEMYYNHPAVIQRVGLQTCAYCHQPVSCARCHKDPVLDGTSSGTDEKVVEPTATTEATAAPP